MKRLLDILDEGDTVDIVYLDFAKAFDSVNHRLLLTKLKCHRIAHSVINWISDDAPSK